MKRTTAVCAGGRLSLKAEKAYYKDRDKGLVATHEDINKGYQGKGTSRGMRAAVMGETYNEKGSTVGMEYFGGGKKHDHDAQIKKSQAWRELKKDALKAVSETGERLEFASTLPMKQRSTRSQAAINWDNVLDEMPVAGQGTISSRKNQTLQHLARLRLNPKYRLKRERFVARDEKTISSLARNGVFPELLALSPDAKAPKHVSLDTQRSVVVDRYVLAAAAYGGSGSASVMSYGSLPTGGVMMAEYITPDEPSRLELWDEDARFSYDRVAVIMGVRDPAQLGQMIRTTVASGCDVVILMDDCSDPYSTEVVDHSLASQVTKGGFPKFYVLRPEDGDDPWGILNRLIRTHNMLPVLAATNEEDQEESVSTDALWRDLSERGESDRKLCMFFGAEKYGLDVDYVKFNLEAESQQVMVPASNAMGLSTVWPSSFVVVAVLLLLLLLLSLLLLRACSFDLCANRCARKEQNK